MIQLEHHRAPVFLRPVSRRLLRDLAVACLALCCGLRVGAQETYHDAQHKGAQGGGSLTQSQAAFPKRPGIYRKGWIDLNKNGVKDPYEDPSLPVEARIRDLLSRMSLEEKTCQLASVYGFAIVMKTPFPEASWRDEVWKDGIGQVVQHLQGRGETDLGWPASNRARNGNELQRFFIEHTRLGIPALMGAEGIKGVEAKASTCFPVPLALGATWNPELVQRAAEVMGREAHLLGLGTLWCPILDVARDARWGRFEESLSEDPWLASRLGVAMVRGIQSQGVLATAKHFGPYGYVKGGREGDARTDPRVTPREMEEISFATWKAAIREGGLMNAMVCYADYDGVPLHASEELLQGRLRRDWGLKGYLISDADGMERLATIHGTAQDAKDAYRQCVNAGMDLWLSFEHPKVYVEALRDLVKTGKISRDTLDRRVAEVLYPKFASGLFDHPYTPEDPAADAVVGGAAHRAVELEVERQSLVLLKNENHTLPLDRKRLKSLAVIGPVADDAGVALKRYGPYGTAVTTILQGLREVAGPGLAVKHAKGCALVPKGWPENERYAQPLSPGERQGIDEAVALGRQCDAIVVAVGDSGWTTSGESRSRTSLDLAGRQEDLVRALQATGKPVIVVLCAGRPTTINWIQDHVPAILLAHQPGASGGQAIAEALFGDLNPGGKLNATYPRSVGQLPLAFPTKPNGNDERLGNWSAGLVGPLYPFGYGLSYTSFQYEGLQVEPLNDPNGSLVRVSFEVRNAGACAGDEVVQLYTRQLLASVTTYEKRLGGFQRVHLQPGERRRVTLDLTRENLEILDRRMHWAVEAGDYKVMVGASSEYIRLEGRFTLSTAP
ncbi:beta-glucosidase [Geothrix limicola]|uniref:Beta-glucosidase n=1 Tax=Geothrix limicola TaxID=2927978 RepID=A0ABQ5QCR8_9BACT|nr:glycoside hydrolase family 3 N-terminal domain-containing protein [Geothrix limicola]GLH72639.1 beta-glucosidase [Geothrix limicola]